jgi:NADH dehydrogenase FAD-containing subunit
MSPVKIWILGGGLGGLYTALHLSKLSKNTSKLAKITLVDDKDHFLSHHSSAFIKVLEIQAESFHLK